MATFVLSLVSVFGNSYSLFHSVWILSYIITQRIKIHAHVSAAVEKGLSLMGENFHHGMNFWSRHCATINFGLTAFVCHLVSATLPSVTISSLL